MNTLELIRCPNCGNSHTKIKGSMQGLTEDDKTLSVDIHYQCDKKHEWVYTFYSENGGNWMKVEEGK